MKLFSKILFFILPLFIFIPSVSAITTNEAINAVNDANLNANDFLNKLNNWVDNNKDAVKYLTDSNFILSLDYNDYSFSINKVIDTLNDNGYASSANSLNVIKNDLITDLNNLDTAEATIKGYLNENVEFGLSGNADIFSKLKNLVNNVEDNSLTLLRSLYNIYYEVASSKVNSYSSIEEVIDYMNLTTTTISGVLDTVVDRIDSWQSIYNKYVSNDEETKFINRYSSYIDNIDNKYTNLYNKAFNKYRAVLESKVATIDLDTNKFLESSVIERNKKLYDIIDGIRSLKTEVQNDYNILIGYVDINFIKNKINEKYSGIQNMLDEQIEYVESYLMDTTLIEVKKAADEKYFDIDAIKSYVVFSDTKLQGTNFINRLTTDYSRLENDNLYNGNVGTGSIIKVYYLNELVGTFTVIVKGDIVADGKISAMDYVPIRNHIMDVTYITGDIYKIASDVNDDNKISAMDYVPIRNFIMNGVFN